MIKETKITKEIIERHKFCDVCGGKIAMGLRCSVAKCAYCKKDLCEACIGHEHETGGDYRIVYCKSCWKIGEAYRPLIEDLQEHIENFYNEWRGKCDKSTS